MSPEPAPPLRPAGAPAHAAPVGGRSARARELRRILAEMLKIDRVRGGLVVAADGLVIAASLPSGIAAEPLAALTATLGRELEVGADRMKRTTFRTALFSADDGGHGAPLRERGGDSHRADPDRVARQAQEPG